MEMTTENSYDSVVPMSYALVVPGLIIAKRPANERRRYFVTTSLIGWTQT